MAEIVRRLALGVVLIVAAAALLLFSDLGSRVEPDARSTRGDRPARVAIAQPASQAILDDGVRGMIDGLAARGYVEGQTLALRRFNAEGDAGVAAAIAREMANGDADLLMTVSTLSLQAVANANRTTRKPHVFSLVSNPAATGVGISATDPLDHPAWIAGYGTMQPVEPAFRLAREMKPDLRRVGVVWNASEANSEGQVKLARAVSTELGIELLEATVDASAGVGEAAAAVIARGAEALFVPGDVMVMVAIDPLIAAARRNNVAVFTVVPPNTQRGALFDLGADYYEVGRHAGELAAEILDGRDPATVPIVNYLPESLFLNEQVAAALASRGWRIPEAIRARARAIVGPDGQEQPGPAANFRPAPPPRAAATPRPRPVRLDAIQYSESLPAEETLAGLREGMAKWPLVEGRDYVFKLRNAQGDIAALNGLIDAALTDRADIVIPISTPSLQAAIRKVKDRPIVFSLVANPLAAGAGTSYEEHLPNVTGIAVLAPADAMLDLLRRHFPHYRRIGTLYCPAEANSVDLKDLLVEMGSERGFEVEAVAASSPAELADAAMALASKPIDAIVQISDNLSSGGFTAVSRAANQARKPLFSLNSTTLALGAPVAFGRDYHEAGLETAAVLLRVINGESPANIPFALPPRVVRKASLPNARANGLTLPPSFLAEMETVVK